MVLQLKQQQRHSFNTSQHYFGPNPSFYHQHIPVLVVNRIYDDQGHLQTLDKLLNGPQGQLWSQALRNDLSFRTKINNSNVQGIDSMKFIHHQDVAQGQKLTYKFFNGMSFTQE